MQFPVEVELQADIIAACTNMGGYGDKIQDKYLKGKPDIWLQLPSGIIIFAEVKKAQRPGNILRFDYKGLQLECLEKLTEHCIPAFGLSFGYDLVGLSFMQISPYKELKATYEEFNCIKFYVKIMQRVRHCGDIIKALEKILAGSVSQQIKFNLENIHDNVATQT